MIHLGNYSVTIVACRRGCVKFGEVAVRQDAEKLIAAGMAWTGDQCHWSEFASLIERVKNK